MLDCALARCALSPCTPSPKALEQWNVKTVNPLAPNPANPNPTGPHRPLPKVLDGPQEELRRDALDTMCALAVALGQVRRPRPDRVRA